MKTIKLWKRALALFLSFLLAFGAFTNLSPAKVKAAETNINYVDDWNPHFGSVSINTIKFNESGSIMYFDYKKWTDDNIGQGMEIRFVFDDEVMQHVDHMESRYLYKDWGPTRSGDSNNMMSNTGYSRRSNLTANGDFSFKFINKGGNNPESATDGIFIPGYETQETYMRVSFKNNFDIRTILGNGKPHYIKSYVVYENRNLLINSRMQIPIDLNSLNLVTNTEQSPIGGRSSGTYRLDSGYQIDMMMHSNYNARFNAIVLDITYRPYEYLNRTNLRGVLLASPDLLPYVDHIEIWRMEYAGGSLFKPTLTSGWEDTGTSVFSTDPTRPTMAKDNSEGAMPVYSPNAVWKDPSTDPNLRLMQPSVENVNGKQYMVLPIAPKGNWNLGAFYNPGSSTNPAKIVIYFKKNLAGLIEKGKTSDVLQFQHFFTETPDRTNPNISNDTFVIGSYSTSSITINDSDHDGLTDVFEQFIGSDPRNPDTDGDGRLDGNEVHSATTERISTGEYKYKGTDPLTPPPSWPEGQIVAGQTSLSGKATGLRTIALMRVPRDGTESQILGETVSDASGNYTITIGKKFSRDPITNNIVGKPNPTEALSKMQTIPGARIEDGDVLLLQCWTDGWNNKGLMFSDAETTLPIVVGKSVPPEPYNLYNTEPVLRGRIPHGQDNSNKSIFEVKIDNIAVPTNQITIDPEHGTFAINITEELKNQIGKDTRGNLPAGTILDIKAAQFNMEPVNKQFVILEGPKFANLKAGATSVTVIPPSDFTKNDIVKVKINNGYPLLATYNDSLKKFVVNDLEGYKLKENDRLTILAVHNSNALTDVTDTVPAIRKTPTPTDLKIQKNSEGVYVLTGKAVEDSTVHIYENSSRIDTTVDHSRTGEFRIEIPSVNAVDKAVFMVTASAPGMRESDPAEITLDALDPAAPVIADAKEGDTVVQITKPSDDAVKLVVNVPVGQSFTLTKNGEGTWELNGSAVQVNNNKLQIPVTALPGKGKIEATAYDPTGNFATSSKDITKKKQFEIYTPEGQDITVGKGETPNAADGIKNKGSLPKETKYSFEGAVDTSEFGSKKVTIIVTYPDGSSETVTVNLTVREQSATYNPEGQDITVDNGQTPNAADGIKNKGSLPAGTEYSFKKAVDTSKRGPQEVTIVVTYPDGSSDEVNVNLTVRKQSETYTPEGQDITVDNGQIPNAADGIKNKGSLPAGTEYSFKKAVDTSKQGPQEVTIIVTYPDGSSDEVNVNLTVRKQSETYTPEGQDITVDKNQKPNPEDGIKNLKDLPDKTIVVFMKGEPDTSKSGTNPVTLLVTYPDHSSDTVIVNLVVNKDSSETFIPRAQDITVDKNQKPNPADGIKNKGELPAKTTYTFKNGEPDTSKAGEQTVIVVVTYPDGSHSDVAVNLIVNKDDSDKNTPEGQPITVNKGDEPNPADGIKNKDKLPKGTEFKFKTGEPDTTEPGTKDLTIVVKYPDGSKDEVTVPVTVKPDESDKYTPIPQPITVDKGNKPNPADGVKNKDELPKGTEFKFKTGEPDTTEPGTKDLTIVVEYPDGSKDEVTVPVTVKPDESDKYDPIPQPITVDKGNKPNPADGVKNKDELPKGTEFKFKTGEPDTTEPGTKDLTIVVTYPDGSKDEISVPVTVDKDDAGKNEPIPQPITVNKGDKPNPADGIKNKDELPKGTEFKFKTGEPDTTKPGTKDLTIVVIYPDGSKDEIGTKLTIEDKDTTAPKKPVIRPIREGDKDIKIGIPTDDTSKITVRVPGKPGEVITITKDPKTGKWVDENGNPVATDGKNLVIPLKEPVAYGKGGVQVTAEDRSGNKTIVTIKILKKIDQGGSPSTGDMSMAYLFFSFAISSMALTAIVMKKRKEEEI